MNLWPHQVRALEEIDALIASGSRRICVASPTGGGKTAIASNRMETSGKPTVFYTNRKMLFAQTSERFTTLGLEHGLRASGYTEDASQAIQLAMMQTEQSAMKKGRQLHAAKEVLVDEAHNNAAAGCMEIFEKHQSMDAECIQIGFTATPLGIGHAYDDLIVAGTNSELRRCGSHVPAMTYAPDEPDTKLVGKVAIGEGECGIQNKSRMVFAQRVFGRVIETYRILNPEGRPAVLFAPGVAESRWFAETLSENGIPAAHIDGENCWVDGETYPSDPDIRKEIEERTQDGDIKIVCNRFVLREGIDWPFIYHGIFATVFGSLTSYLQAGGRIVRNHESMDEVCIQDHGGNWWRHGSLNADRNWSLESNDRIEAGVRTESIRENKEPEPIVCPKCSAVRLSGSSCVTCGYFYEGRKRPVLQADGSLKAMTNATFRPRRYAEKSKQIEDSWVGRVEAVRRSKKETVANRTFSQLSASFARDNNWCYPPKGMVQTPMEDEDWFRPVKDVPRSRLN